MKKKIPTTLARARLYRGRTLVAHHRFKKTTCSSSLQKHLIGNYESKKHIRKLYAMRSGRNVLARFQTEIFFSIKKIKEKRKKKCFLKEIRSYQPKNLRAVFFSEVFSAGYAFLFLCAISSLKRTHVISSEQLTMISYLSHSFLTRVPN